MKTFKLGGIHPPESKLTAGMPIVALELPRRVEILLSQHIGAPALACVAVGDKVVRGQMIASPAGFISAPVHASISGTVKAITTVNLPSGYTAPAIVIEADDEQHRADEIARKAQIEADAKPADRSISEDFSRDTIRRLVSEAGIVGLGGATFPATVKLSTKEGAEPELLLINACECEPYLTCDDALMRAYASNIMEGIELMMKASGVRRAVIGIERNKPEAIAALRNVLDPTWPIEICPLKTKYPQGGEKQLVEAVIGRRIPSGALPASVGVIVNNVATAFAVYAAVCRGRALTDRVITVTGDVPNRGNYLVAVGTSIKEILGEIPDDCKVILGGPMMGRTAATIDTPVTKGTSGLLVLSTPYRREEQACIRCAGCVQACPMGLEPYLLSTYGRLRMWDEARQALVADCIECGSCSYTCPSSKPLLDYIRIAKSTVMAQIRAEKSQK